MNKDLRDPDHSMKDEGNNIEIIAENQKDRLQLPVKDLLFIQSEGNYISIFHKEETEIRRSLLRNTLKNIEKELGSFSPPLFKTHRSYIVNLDLVENIKGNSQGLQLYLSELDDFVPVSRSYINSVREALKSNN
jgi:DNA-binding LytR/AlgR family response regulator